MYHWSIDCFLKFCREVSWCWIFLSVETVDNVYASNNLVCFQVPMPPSGGAFSFFIKFLRYSFQIISVHNSTYHSEFTLPCYFHNHMCLVALEKSHKDYERKSHEFPPKSWYSEFKNLNFFTPISLNHDLTKARYAITNKKIILKRLVISVF